LFYKLYVSQDIVNTSKYFCVRVIEVTEPLNNVRYNLAHLNHSSLL